MTSYVVASAWLYANDQSFTMIRLGESQDQCEAAFGTSVPHNVAEAPLGIGTAIIFGNDRYSTLAVFLKGMVVSTTYAKKDGSPLTRHDALVLLQVDSAVGPWKEVESNTWLRPDGAGALLQPTSLMLFTDQYYRLTKLEPKSKPTVQAPVPQINMSQFRRVYGTVLQRLKDGYLVNVGLFEGQNLAADKIVLSGYLHSGVTPSNDYFVASHDLNLVDNDPIDGIVRVTDQVYSFETTEGAQRTVRVLAAATNEEMVQLKKEFRNERQTASENSTEVVWVEDPGHGDVQYTFRRSAVEWLKTAHGLKGRITVDLITRVQSGDSGAVNSIAQSLSSNDKELLVKALQTARPLFK